eukprot:TRINITY_DN409_c0_g1_i1.p1 TRINITY_DN409_c0_g1~~TRINITY_DN409_c0_g1_i1.p1  ORF type:complete len:539 (-),score=81.20 TRINITY_DN409_c0_g1_i1:663-2279(-)
MLLKLVDGLYRKSKKKYEQNSKFHRWPTQSLVSEEPKQETVTASPGNVYTPDFSSVRKPISNKNNSPYRATVMQRAPPPVPQRQTSTTVSPGLARRSYLPPGGGAALLRPKNLGQPQRTESTSIITPAVPVSPRGNTRRSGPYEPFPLTQTQTSVPALVSNVDTPSFTSVQAGSDCDYGTIVPKPVEIQALALEEGPSATGAQALVLDMIEDEVGKKFWKSFEGGDTFFLNWHDFEAEYLKWQDVQNSFGAFSIEDREMLQSVLDTAEASMVTAHKFNDFLKSFGPMKDSFNNLKSMMAQPWFQGFVSREETEHLLHRQPTGTFLVRFSQSYMGSFVLAVAMKQSRMLHILINKKPDNQGFAVKEGNDDKETLYPSISQLLSHYRSRGLLTGCCLETFHKEKFFHGDLQREEAEEILRLPENNVAGTFLFRFSSQKGSFTASSVLANGSIRHIRLIRSPTGLITENDGSFKDLHDFVSYCKQQGAFLKPVTHTRNRSFAKRKTSIIPDSQDVYGYAPNTQDSGPMYGSAAELALYGRS